MKKIFFFIMAFMVSLPLTAQNSNSNINVSISPAINSDLQNFLLNRLLQDSLQISCDDPNDTTLGCDWSNIPWDTYSVEYDTLSEFPDCPIIVTYKARRCHNNPLIMQIYIINIFIDLANYTNCNNLYNYIYSDSSDINAIHYQEIKEKIYFLLCQREAQQMADLPPCDSLGNYLPQTVFYKEQACKSILTFNGYDSNYVKIIVEPREVVCSREVGCCKTTFSFCQDSIGSINPQITKELIGIDCSLAYPIESDYEYLVNVIFRDYPEVKYVTFDLTSCYGVCQ